MKRVILILMTALILTIGLLVETHAALPTVKSGGEWEVLISEDFEGDKPTYFTHLLGSPKGRAYVNEDGNSENTVVDLKLGEVYTADSSKAGYNLPYNNVRIGQGASGSDNLDTGKTLASKYMIEFDLCGKNLTGGFTIGVRSATTGGNYGTIRLNPDSLEKDVWYTYRIVVSSTSTNDIHKNTTRVYRKLRDSNDDFVQAKGDDIPDWDNDTDRAYGIGGSYVNKAMSFGIVAHRSYARPFADGMDESLSTMTVDGTSAVENCFTAILDTHYQIDNITVYNGVEQSAYELSEGVYKSYDMDYPSGTVTSEYLTNVIEPDGNGYGVICVSDQTYVEGTDFTTVVPLTSDPDYIGLPETFVLSFDASNKVKGFPLHVEVYGDGTEVGIFPRYAFYIKSCEETEDKWYSYKVVCKGTPKATGQFTFKIYRKEMGSDEPYTELSGVYRAGENGKNVDKDYGTTSAVGRDIGWKNRIRIGDSRYSWLSAYTDDVKNSAEGIWHIDNLTVTDIAAVTGDVYIENDEIKADISLSTSTLSSVPVLALYDEGKLIWSDMDIVNDAEGTVSLRGKYDLSTLVDPDTKLFIWDKETYAPLLDAMVVDSLTDNATSDIVDSPIEKEYAEAFTVDWSEPESYADWSITESSSLRINENTGILTFDVNNSDSVYQVERSLKTPDNFDFEFRMKFDDYGDGAFLIKVTKWNRNNYQYFRPKFIGMTDKITNKTHGVGTMVDIGYDWHDWKFEVRGDFCTIYMDGGEVCRFEQPTTGQRSMLRFLLDAKLNNSYKIHLGTLKYTPYFPEVTLVTPANNAEFLENEEIVLKATVEENLEYVDFFVNGLKVGRGYAPNYEYMWKSAKQGTYRVSTGVEGSFKGVESIITVKPGFNAWVTAENGTISYGDSAKLSLDYEMLIENEALKPSQVTYFVNGENVGTVKTAPFELNIDNLPVGTASVYASVTNSGRTVLLTDEFRLQVISDGNEVVSLNPEYEIDYTVGAEGELLVSDGYFALEVGHKDGKLNYETDDGTKEYALDGGSYKIVAASGIADLYYNGQFALSWHMPKSESGDSVQHSGLTDFVIGGSGVKTFMLLDEWSGEAEYSAKTVKYMPNYSIEFDKTDASDERITFYDGEYCIDLDVRDGKIYTVNHDVETGIVKPVVLEGAATSGYWRITVVKGLAQVFIDNEYIGSFGAEEDSRGPELFRIMDNPSASTFIAIKGTDDKYYHVDDFGGNAELDSIDYWFEDSDEISATLSDGALKLEGSGDVYLNANSDDVWMKWSAKVDGTGKFYVSPRTFRGPHYHLRVGYDFVTAKWFVKQWSNDYTYPYDKETTYSGAAMSQNVWHDFELTLVEDKLVLKMDGVAVVEAEDIAMPFWGFTGFGIDNGTAMIDNLDYVGRGKVTAGIKTMEISNSVGISEIFKTSTGRVVALNAAADMIYTDDNGETWSEPEKNTYGIMTGATLLQDGRLFRLVGKNGNDYLSYVSSDDGKTWTQTGKLSDCRTAARRVFRNGTLTQLSNGRIIIACDETFTEANSITGIYYTDDFGKTWHETKTAMGISTSKGLTTENTGFNIQEGILAELPNGTVRYFGRTGLGFIYYMDSADGGENFGELRPFRLMNTLTSFSVVRDDEDANTYYAITSYDATTYSYRTVHSPRNRLSLFVSYDGMKTWEYAMTLNESQEMPNWDSCNHVLKVFDGTIYVNWNNLNGDRRSFIYAIDKTKLRTTKRLEEVHERVFLGYVGRTTFDKQCIVPKKSGTGYIYGMSADVYVKNELFYDPSTIAKIFGTRYSSKNGVYTFALGNGSVVFTEGESTYTVNGVQKTFDEACVEDGYFNIKACAEAFGKVMTEGENSYVLWYNQPLTPQFAEDYLLCI